MRYMGIRTNDIKCKPCNWCTEYTERTFKDNVLRGTKVLYCMNEKVKSPQYSESCFSIGGYSNEDEEE